MKPPTDEELAALEVQLAELPDVSDFDKKNKRQMLLKMLHLGNVARAMGVSEDYIRRVMPGMAPQVLVLSWEKLGSKLENILKGWAAETKKRN